MSLVSAAPARANIEYQQKDLLVSLPTATMTLLTLSLVTCHLSPSAKLPVQPVSRPASPLGVLLGCHASSRKRTPDVWVWPTV